MKAIWIFLLCTVLTACHSSETVKNKEQTGFNAALASELGADDYGMRSYVMVILTTGPNDKTITDAETRNTIFAGHFANIRALAANKTLVLAGPFNDPDKIKRGLYIFNVKTVEEAKRLVLTDPAVEAGIFNVEFTPYYGSAALLKVNDIHAQIAKENPS